MREMDYSFIRLIFIFHIALKDVRKTSPVRLKYESKSQCQRIAEHPI